MLPLSDGIPARRFPWVNVAPIAANFIVFVSYELPHFDSAVFHASFYPCTLAGTCHGPVARWLASVGAAPGRAGEGGLARAGVTP